MSSKDKRVGVARHVIIAMYIVMIAVALTVLIIGAMKANVDLVLTTGAIIVMTVCALIAIT